MGGDNRKAKKGISESKRDRLRKRGEKWGVDSGRPYIETAVHSFIPTMGTQCGSGRTDMVPALMGQTDIYHLLLRGKATLVWNTLIRGTS